jgi:hypothetical protein
MNDFSYELPDPDDVVERLITTLEHGRPEDQKLAELLGGAYIEFNPSSDFSDRWNAQWLDVSVNVRPEALIEAQEHRKRLHRNMERMIPGGTGYDVREVSLVAGQTSRVVDLKATADKMRRGLAELGYWGDDRGRVAQMATSEAELVRLGPAERHPEFTEYAFRLKVHPKVFSEWAGERGHAGGMEKRIERDVRPIFNVEMPGKTNLNRVQIGPKVEDVKDGWEEMALEWVIGEGINNQGRAHSQNVAQLEEDYLLFRSQPEIHLYRALKAFGYPLAPLPVFVQGGEDTQRIEPDFVMIYKGLCVVIEVDGAMYHDESPAKAHKRLAFLTNRGAKSFRVEATDCNTELKAEKSANGLMESIKEYYESR